MSWSWQQKQVFVEQFLGLFLAQLGLFRHFVPGLLTIALGSKPPPLARKAEVGLGTRLPFIRLQHSLTRKLKTETKCHSGKVVGMALRKQTYWGRVFCLISVSCSGRFLRRLELKRIQIRGVVLSKVQCSSGISIPVCNTRCCLRVEIITLWMDLDALF